MMYPKDNVEGLENSDDFQRPIKKVRMEMFKIDSEDIEDIEENEEKVGYNQELTVDPNTHSIVIQCEYIPSEEQLEDEMIGEWQEIQLKQAIKDNIINTQHRPQTDELQDVRLGPDDVYYDEGCQPSLQMSNSDSKNVKSAKRKYIAQFIITSDLGRPLTYKDGHIYC